MRKKKEIVTRTLEEIKENERISNLTDIEFIDEFVRGKNYDYDHLDNDLMNKINK